MAKNNAPTPAPAAPTSAPAAEPTAPVEPVEAAPVAPSVEELQATIEAAVARATAVPSGTATFVAKANLRIEAGWVRPGETFDASDAELEGYELGKHFDLKD